MWYVIKKKYSRDDIKQLNKWVWLSPWKFLIWHGVDGGGDDDGEMVLASRRNRDF